MPRGVSIYDEAKLQGRLWTPACISSLAGWWDASDTNTMTFGTGVSQWTSKFGGPYVSQSTTNAQPTFAKDKRTGVGYLTFNGSSQFLRYNGTPSGFPTGTSAMTLVVSGRATGGTGNFSYAVYYGSASGASQDGRMILAFPDNIIYCSIYSGSNIAPDVAGAAAGTGISWLANDAVATISIPAGTNPTITGSVNGYDASASSGVASVSPNFVIGASLGGTQEFFSGNIFDVLVFGEALSKMNTRRIEGFCAWKAGIQATLAPTHPFKNRPPMIGD